MYRTVIFAQEDSWVKFTIKTGICHGAKPMNITVVARKNTLKRFMKKEDLKFGNCNYLLETDDQIVKSATPTDPPPGDAAGGEKIWISDPGEFLELYKREKEAKSLSGEICVNTDGEISFSIGTEDARIGISTKGTISLSAKSPNGLTHTAEF